MTTDAYVDKRPAHGLGDLTAHELEDGAAVWLPVSLRPGDRVVFQPPKPKRSWWRFWGSAARYSGTVTGTFIRGESIELRQALDLVCDRLMTAQLHEVGVTVMADHLTFGLEIQAYADLKYMLGFGMTAWPVPHGESFTYRKLTFYVADRLSGAVAAGRA